MVGGSICVDFDGVIHSYASGFKGNGVVPDPPVPGALEWLDECLRAGLQVAIYSARSCSVTGIAGMRAWFVRHGFDPDRLVFPQSKPAAGLYIDDRGYHFTGDNFPSPEEILAFRPWWYPRRGQP